MIQTTESEAILLESLMQQAALGNRKAAQRFFEIFLQTQLVVLERFQPNPLSNSPRYPDDFFNILAIQDRERVIVPAFSNPLYIEEWSGQAFKYRLLSGEKLLNLLPENWILDLNPGQEFGKEFSAWEISELKLGPQAIPALLEENFADDDITPAHIQSLADNEYQQLKSDLISFAEQQERILRMSLLKEYQSDLAESDSKGQLRLLLGAWLDQVEEQEQSQLSGELEAIARKSLIGAEPIQVYCGLASKQNLALSIFQKTEPFFSRNAQQSLSCKILAGFRRLLGQES